MRHAVVKSWVLFEKPFHVFPITSKKKDNIASSFLHLGEEEIQHSFASAAIELAGLI
jgi:hypothetical protein